ncbi:MAG: hypothetical protein AABX04_05915 [Nanoarchaeota archaeon]
MVRQLPFDLERHRLVDLVKRESAAGNMNAAGEAANQLVVLILGEVEVYRKERQLVQELAERNEDPRVKAIFEEFIGSMDVAIEQYQQAAHRFTDYQKRGVLPTAQFEK